MVLEDAHFDEGAVALFAELLPAVAVGAAVFVDVFGLGVEGEVGGVVGQIQEKRRGRFSVGRLIG